MNIILRILNIFFVVLGIMFFIVLVGAGYVWFADPFHLFSPTVDSSKVDNVDKNPLLNEQQEAQLEGMGINPASLPTQITPAMEECFTQKLGQKRTDEIKQGSAPTPVDFFKAQSCF